MIDIHSISTKDIYIPTHASTSMKDRKLYSLLFMNGLADTMNSQPIYICSLFIYNLHIFLEAYYIFIFNDKQTNLSDGSRKSEHTINCTR